MLYLAGRTQSDVQQSTFREDNSLSNLSSFGGQQASDLPMNHDHVGGG